MPQEGEIVDAAQTQAQLTTYKKDYATGRVKEAS